MELSERNKVISAATGDKVNKGGAISISERMRMCEYTNFLNFNYKFFINYIIIAFTVCKITVGRRVEKRHDHPINHCKVKLRWEE